MTKKVFIVLLIGFIAQTIFSCTCPCDTRDSEVIYNGIDVFSRDTSGFRDEPVGAEVKRNVFGLRVELKYEQVFIGLNDTNGNFGFNKALACDCDPGRWTIIDPIDNLNILMTDLASNDTQNVTDLFYIYSYEGLKSVSDYFDETESDMHPHIFSLELVDYEAIPDSVIFEVILALESSKELTVETEPINFID